MELLNTAKPYSGQWKQKAEEWLCRTFPTQIEAGWYEGIHVGRNRDAAVSQMGGFKTTNTSMHKSALYLEVPDRVLAHPDVVANKEALIPTFAPRVNDAVARMATAQVKRLVQSGMKPEEAQAQVADAVQKIGYYDAKSGLYVTEPVTKSTHDSILSGLATPYWNVSKIQKIFRQPFIRGYADRLVSKVGVPNIWADLLQIFVASYEGRARVSAAARTNGMLNTSVTAASRAGTMLSEFINLVIDYESPDVEEQRLGGMEGWLVGVGVSDRDVYANLMLDQLMNILYYFGHAESGFLGLQQIADRDDAVTYYPSNRPPASYLWENDGAGSGTGPVNTTVGADLLLMLNHFLADRLEELHFLPVTCRVNCAPVLWKAFKFSMLSKVYNQNSPLSIIDTWSASDNRVVGTLVTRAGNGLSTAFEICPDPMLAPGTPFNDTDEDLMFITFPELQSEMGDQTELVMAPTAIDKMVLPSAPVYRGAMVRTSLKRIGSLLCPLRKTVHVVSGMGTNSRYTA